MAHSVSQIDYTTHGHTIEIFLLGQANVQGNSNEIQQVADESARQTVRENSTTTHNIGSDPIDIFRSALPTIYLFPIM